MRERRGPVAPAPVDAATRPAGRGTDETPVAPPVAAGVPVSYLDVAAPWAARMGGRRLDASARVPRRPRPLRYDDAPPGSTSSRSSRRSYGPLDDGLDLERETMVDYDDRDFRADGCRARALRAAGGPVDEASFFGTRARHPARLVDRRPLELQRNARSSSCRGPVRPRRTSLAAATRRRRRQPTRRRRRSATGSKPSATGWSGARAGAATRRGARRGRQHAARQTS